MSFEPRISMELVERIEDMKDRVRRAHEDGTITADEETEVTELIEDIYRIAMDLDDALGISTTLMRRGVSSPSARRRLAEHNLRLIYRRDDDGPRAA